MRHLPFLLALTCTACGPASRSEPGPAGIDNPRSVPAANVDRAPADFPGPEALAGEYRVAGAGGEPIDMPHAATASIDEDSIEVTSACVRMAWSYRLEDGTIATEAIPVETCERELMPAEEAIRAALDAARQVARTPENGIAITGEGQSVTLFSQ